MLRSLTLQTFVNQITTEKNIYSPLLLDKATSQPSQF